MMKIYDINYGRLVLLLLPTFLRELRIIAFLRAFVFGVEWTYNRFTVFRYQDLFRESIDCSIPRLEYMLNSMFYPAGLDDAYAYRIVIENFVQRGVIRIYLGGIMHETDEGHPQFLNPVRYIYTGSEAGEIHADFVVKVPATVKFDEARMKAMINAFVLPDKFFEIIKY